MTSPGDDGEVRVVRVLLCDDSDELRKLTRWALERAGQEIVAEAADGDAAVQLAGSTKTDVILLDLDMPGPPAAELLCAVEQAAAGTPIVTYSGYDPMLVAPEHVGLVVAHVPKMTDLAVLAATVREVAEGRAAA